VTGVPTSLACELLTESLNAWRVAGHVEPVSKGAIAITAKKNIRIERAPDDSMFRWMVTVEGRKRGAISLLAVLRRVRGALDPEHAGSSVRLAVAPPVLR
jgi:hypothetical protein